MGIMEKNLPVAESIGEGDMVRIVTGGGNSKNVDASKIGGGDLLLLSASQASDSKGQYVVLDKTFSEITEAVNNGRIPYIINNLGQGTYMISFMSSSSSADDTYSVDFVIGWSFVADSADGELKMYM